MVLGGNPIIHMLSSKFYCSCCSTTDQSIQEKFSSYMIGDGFSEEKNGRVDEIRTMKAGEIVRKQHGQALFAFWGCVRVSQLLP
jgi:hypothetical protein